MKEQARGHRALGARRRFHLPLTVEHRAGASVLAVPLVLAERGDALALEVIERSAAPEPPFASVDERITRALAGAERLVPLADLRAAFRIRNATLGDRLVAHTAAGTLLRSDEGYRLASR